MVEVKAENVAFKGMRPVWSIIDDKESFVLLDVPKGWEYDKTEKKGVYIEVRLRKVV